MRFATLKLKLPIELPPVGLITMRQRVPTPAAQQLMDCLRVAAKRAFDR